MAPDERLPDDFSFEDFLDALDRADAAEDVDLPTDWDGCVLLATLPVTEVAAVVAKLDGVGIAAHTELPDGGAIGRDETGAVFVPFSNLAQARTVLGLEA